MTETMQLIITEAIKFLAAKHDADALEIIAAYAASETAVVEQVNQLIEVAVDQVIAIKEAL